ncbi:MAG: peptidylprolyl isomerase [Ignavibacteriales bacterium]|nr:peptidylprolyl isomerase [Ignavibacteriales bacterium]
MKLRFFFVVAWTIMLLIGSVSSGGCQTKTKNPQVLFSTSLGDITIELFADKAPITVKNFLAYVDSGFYNGTTFHRVIPGFVIQGGGFTSGMVQKKTFPPIKNEADNGLKNLRGTLSMARTSDINSATSQFFVNLKDNAMLDNNPNSFGYAVFGKVAAGMEVVDKITQVPTGNRQIYQNVPLTDVVVKSAKRK